MKIKKPTDTDMLAIRYIERRLIAGGTPRDRARGMAEKQWEALNDPETLGKMCEEHAKEDLRQFCENPPPPDDLALWFDDDELR